MKYFGLTVLMIGISFFAFGQGTGICYVNGTPAISSPNTNGYCEWAYDYTNELFYRYDRSEAAWKLFPQAQEVVLSPSLNINGANVTNVYVAIDSLRKYLRWFTALDSINTYRNDSIYFRNGLKLGANGNVVLGGALNQNTTINTNGDGAGNFYQFNLNRFNEHFQMNNTGHVLFPNVIPTNAPSARIWGSADTEGISGMVGVQDGIAILYGKTSTQEAYLTAIGNNATLSAQGNMYIKTPGVNAGTATVNHYLKLLNATTGATEWAAVSGSGNVDSTFLNYYTSSYFKKDTTDVRRTGSVVIGGTGLERQTTLLQLNGTDNSVAGGKEYFVLKNTASARVGMSMKGTGGNGILYVDQNGNLTSEITQNGDDYHWTGTNGTEAYFNWNSGTLGIVQNNSTTGIDFPDGNTNSPNSGEGIVSYNSAFDALYLYTTQGNEQVRTVLGRWEIFEETFSGGDDVDGRYGDRGWGFVPTNGADASLDVSGIAGEVGYMEIQTLNNSAATGKLTPKGKNFTKISASNEFFARFIIYIPTLFDGTDIGTIYVGLVDSSGTTDGNSVVQFVYDSGVSGNWQIECRRKGTTTTNSPSTAVATGRSILDMVYNGSGVTFLLNGTSLGTITANIPTGVTMKPYFAIEKSGGGNNRVLGLGHCMLGLKR